MIDLDATVLAAAQAAFAETVSWCPLDGEPLQVAAIFFDAVVEEKWHDGVAVTERVIRIDCRTGAFPRLPRLGDLFVVRGRLYGVTEAMDDGVGCVSMRIRFASDAERAQLRLAPAPPP